MAFFDPLTRKVELAHYKAGNMSIETFIKFAVYDLRTYFSKQPGDIRCCPVCGSSLSRSNIDPSECVSNDLSDMRLIPMHDFSHLYECRACQWWAVRESWSLCELYKDFDFLIVGEAERTGTAFENTNQKVMPWNLVLQNEHLYASAMPLTDVLGKLFLGGEKNSQYSEPIRHG